MPAFIDKLTGKTSQQKPSSKGDNNDEQSFSIQPHPAKTNDPADLAPSGPGGGLRSDPVMGAHHARDPHVPSQQIMNNLEQPLSREELHARQAELNK